MKFQFMEKHSTFNIQHSTPNQPDALHSFDVECSMLNVECWFDLLPRQRETQP